MFISRSTHTAFLRSLACAAVSGLALAAGQTANATVLIDDFTQTESPSPYPSTVVASFPGSVDLTSDEFGLIAETPGFRVVNFGPVLTTEQALSGVFDGSQTISLDTGAGRLTSTSTGDGAPLLQLAWSASDFSAKGLNLDLTSEAGMLIRFTTNLSVNARISLLQIDEASSSSFEHEAGSADTVVLQAGENALFIPFADFDEIISERRIVSGPPFTTSVDLAPIGLDEVDTLTLLISPIDDATVPEGLVLSFDQVAFVPEPTSMILLIGGGLLLCQRRRR